MKTLFLSDLDGTLLNTEAVVSEYTRAELNRLIDEGVFFTIATARTAATVTGMLSGIHINIPAILMNGVALYDLERREYVCSHSLSPECTEELAQAIEQAGSRGFFYCIDNNTLSTLYVNTDSPNSASFIEERETKYGKLFTKIKSLDELNGHRTVYYSVSDVHERLEPLNRLIQKIRGLRTEFYRDIYCDGLWYLEVCSERSSKYNAAQQLRKDYGFDKLVGFGDNLNDISLFNACDESYAVENAKPEIKSAASAVIASNSSDGVVKHLAKLFSDSQGEK